MADGQDGGGTAVVGLLAVCVVLGMASGASRVYSSSSGSATSTPSQSSHVVIENADRFAGTFQVRTDSCQDAPNVDDVARVEVNDASGRVADAQEPVVGSSPVEHVSVGNNLPSGRYTISVHCLSGGLGVGDVYSTTVQATRATDRTSGTVTDIQTTSDESSSSVSRPTALPNSGR